MGPDMVRALTRARFIMYSMSDSSDVEVFVLAAVCEEI
jgi:hypothetical protein